MKDPEPEPPAKLLLDFLRMCGKINACCFRLLSLDVIWYIAIDN